MTGAGNYQLLARAIAARTVAIRFLPEAGATAFTDGQSIFIPEPDLTPRHHDWLAIVAQAALIGGGSLETPIVRHLVGRPTLTKRYLALEVVRLSRNPTLPLPALFRDTLSAAERSVVATSPVDSLNIASSGARVASAPDFCGAIEPLLLLSRAVQRSVASSRQPASREHGLDANESREYAPAEESTLVNRLFTPLVSLSSMSDRIRTYLSGEKGADNLSGNGAVEIKVKGMKLSTTKGITRSAGSMSSAQPLPPPMTAQYAEWDATSRSYRHNWVRVEQRPALADGPGRRPAVSISTSNLRLLRKALIPLGLSHELRGRERDGVDLDATALLDAAIDLRAGHGTDSPQVYRATRRTRRDLGVCVVVDISGSTEESVSSQGKQFDKQLQTAYEISKVFHDLGDVVDIFAFHSWGRHRVYCLQLKAHGERWTTAVRNRFERLEPSGFTRLGAAIRHAQRRLNDHVRQPYRLAVLITDGFAYDQQYEDRYADEDVRRALDEARSTNIACLCICVGSTTPTTRLTTLFHGTGLIAVNEPRDVIASIGAQCRSALGRARMRRSRQTLPSVS